MIGTLRRIALPATPGAFRLWLALVVVLHHITRIEFGKAPVLVFFALSGFWVHRVWTTRYAVLRRPWLMFMLSRWWRIAPVMVLATVLSLAVLAWFGDPCFAGVLQSPVRQVVSTLFVLGYAGMAERPLGPAWSLDIEMQFYLVAPALVMLVRRTSGVVALACGYGIYLVGMALYPEVVLTSFLPFFVVGMVAAEHRWTVSPRLAEAALGLAILLTVAMLLSPWHASLLGEGGAHWTAVNILLAALALPQALVSVRARGDARDGVWADQSYIVYMLHWPAILIWRAVTWPNGLAAGAGLVVLVLAVALLAWLVRMGIDLPLNRARSRWVAGKRAAPGGGCPPAVGHAGNDAKGDDRGAVFA